MPELPLRLALLITGFTVVSGIFDSIAFTYASKIWRDGQIVWVEMARCMGSFLLGIGSYAWAVKYLIQAGVVMPEVQTLIWFGVTIVGVGILGGRFLEWPALDQLIALNVLLSIGVLIVRTAET